MNKIRVIDLLNKIANGEAKYPIKWKWYGSEYEIEDETNLVDFHCMYHTLNDEIEIIEDPKKIEKINWNEKCKYKDWTTSEFDRMLMNRTEQLKKNLNEIIDYINSKEDKK